ncbi:MAG: hypothetical protein HC924_10005 [Synechococcaceae cyanobacterium SM2_3_2]|nr:hypothetical protein [Synechococcaceae cyanobacterium SM2_3_2]
MMGSPYDRLYLAESSRALILYGLTPSTLTVLGETLKGEITPQGHLPI